MKVLFNVVERKFNVQKCTFNAVERMFCAVKQKVFFDKTFLSSRRRKKNIALFLVNRKVLINFAG